MSENEAYTIVFTAAGWIASLIIQLFILSKQNTFKRKITELQNSLGARREIASYKLDNLSLMTKWIDEGLDIQSEVLPIETFLKDDHDGYFNDPNPDRSKIVNRMLAWSNSSKRLIVLAQIYDSKTEKSAREWDNQYDRELPEDLPRLLEAFQRVVNDYVWKQIMEYDEFGQRGYPGPPEVEETLASLIPDAGKYIISVYQKTQVALERVKEFVVIEPLSSI